MKSERKNQLINSKIKRIQANMEYNQVELELAQKMNRPTKKFEERIAESQQELKALEEMRP